MYRAMTTAPVGDDVFEDDPTVKKLEAMAAERLGKEAALLVPTGTMGNTIAILSQSNPGEELIGGAKSHILSYETGAPARIAMLGYATADNPDGAVHADDVRRLTRPNTDSRFCKTALVLLENALYDGRVVPMDVMHGACDAAHELGLRVHLDGARVFNAAASLGVDAAKLVSGCDTVMFCISKGLCAPVGSLLCGDRDTIARAKYLRKMMGGAMRQSGVLAACGIVALEQHVDRLAEDHENARLLGKLLGEIEGIDVKQERLHINMVYFSVDIPGFSFDDFVAFMYGKGFKIMPESEGEYRFVTHYYVTPQDVIAAAEATKAYVAQLKQ